VAKLDHPHITLDWIGSNKRDYYLTSFTFIQPILTKLNTCLDKFSSYPIGYEPSVGLVRWNNRLYSIGPEERNSLIREIDSLYFDFIAALRSAANQSILNKKNKNVKKYWWDQELKELKEKSFAIFSPPG